LVLSVLVLSVLVLSVLVLSVLVLSVLVLSVLVLSVLVLSVQGRPFPSAQQQRTRSYLTGPSGPPTAAGGWPTAFVDRCFTGG
jgi:hypothetical protein